jgi:MoCo/4Fe-4S cofactor protein with predicted Tat translocation signal
MEQKNKHKGVWIGTDQLTNDSAYQESSNREFMELPVTDQLTDRQTLDTTSSRRDFLKYLGFGLGAATIASSCEIPVKKAIPYVVMPDEIVPGVASYYASTFVAGGDYCPVLVKTREGRPIKIEGNSLSSMTTGGTSARAQASVLSLYDTSRITGPYRITDGRIDKPTRRSAQGPGWEEIDGEILGRLSPNAQVRIVANTILSPTTKKAIEDFKAKFPNTKVVMYDPASASALLQANEQCFGQNAIPDYHFDRAKIIVGFEADFLGSWISPIEYAADYIQNRRITDINKADISRHYQVEAHMSMTGSNADNRILVKPSEQGAAIVTLYNELAAMTGGQRVSGPSLPEDAANRIRRVAQDLANHRGQAIVVSGSNNVGEQVLINAINTMLDSYGNTMDFTHASFQRQGSDAGIQELIREMNNGSVDALFVMGGANPAYDLPNADQFRAGMEQVGLKVSFALAPNETLSLCDFATPTHHYLESWGDAMPKKGHYSLLQPTIAPLFRTRQAEESLLRWSQSETLNTEAEQPYLDYLKARWEEVIFPQQSEFATFQAFWDSTLHDGVYEIPQPEVAGYDFGGDVNAAARQVRQPSGAELEIAFYETVNMGAGQYANNPWLMEMPDPVNRCVWGNYLAIPVGWEGGNHFTALNNLNQREARGEADLVEVDVNGRAETVTCVRQFGQMHGTVALALGYGRENTGEMGRALGERVGVNVFPWLTIDENGHTQYYAAVNTISDKVGTDDRFACVQYHHSMGLKGVEPETGDTINVDEKTIMTIGGGYQGGLTDRSVIYRANAGEVKELVRHIEEKREEAAALNQNTLYPYEKYKEELYSQGHHWNMHIDLNACIGCGACQVACIAENNVPIVGKEEVARHHEMTWLRIDRYFYGDYENPSVVYQPMLCQQCDNAPCENVCPVSAVNHNSEGLNQMIYNRCIGTRYCANNCPYKVRRFNWLDFTTADIFPANEYTVQDEEVPFGADNLTRMVLNPDVTVRSRGVMEKCSFCMQRLQEGKLRAKREQRRLRDEDVKTACQTACPTSAIVFGDGNNPDGSLTERLLENPLNYRVLEEINTQTSVLYSAKINNRNEALDA